MSEKYWSVASLRISSTVMSATEITTILQLKPTKSFEKGTPINRRHPNGSKRHESLWILDSNLDKSDPLKIHIKELLSLIEKKINLLAETVPNCHIDIFCGLSSTSGQGGLVLDAEILKRMTAIPIDIILDLYPIGESNNY